MPHTTVGWSLSGNANTDPAVNFIGTTDRKAFKIKTYDVLRMFFEPTGNIGICINTPQANMHLHEDGILYTFPPHLFDRDEGTGEDSSRSAFNYSNTFLMTNPNTGTTANNGFTISQFNKEITLRQQEEDNFKIFGTEEKGLVIAPNGNITVGKTASNANYQLYVDGSIASKGNISINDGVGSIALGNASDKDLAYGTSYIGFNAIRNPSTKTWTCAGDGANNGGSVIWSNVQGTIFFATIPRTGANAQTLTDAQIKQNIKLQLNPDGALRCKEVKITLTGWPDYVLDKDYNLMPLKELEKFITENNHLPEVPSAAEVEENGVQLGEMNAILLKKIEELTLYIITLQKQINELKQKGGK